MRTFQRKRVKREWGSFVKVPYIGGQVPCSGVAVCAFGSVFSSVFEVRRLAGCGHHWRLLCGA